MRHIPLKSHRHKSYRLESEQPSRLNCRALQRGKSDLPKPLKDRLVELARRPHSFLPVTAFSEADTPSQLFQYYLLDTMGFEPNVFTTIVPGINDGTKPTATGPTEDRISYRINGVDFTETHIIALSAARWGIPVIMVSGDNILGEQLKPDFPELEYAVVKTAESRALAEPLPPAEAAKRIEQAAMRAMGKFLKGEYRPYYLPPPYDFQLGFMNWQQADGAASTPGVMRDGELGVRYRSTSFIEGYRLSNDVLQRSDDTLQVLTRILSQDPQGKKYLDQLDEGFWARWLTPEKAAPYMQPGPRFPAKTRFYGSN